MVHYLQQQQRNGNNEERIKTIDIMALQIPDDNSMPSGFAAFTEETRKLPNVAAMNNAPVLIDINNTLPDNLRNS